MKIAITSLELEILRKSASGQTVQQIASELNVNPKVVSKSQKDVLSRTATSNVMNALQELARRGFELREHTSTLKV